MRAVEECVENMNRIFIFPLFVHKDVKLSKFKISADKIPIKIMCIFISFKFKKLRLILCRGHNFRATPNTLMCKETILTIALTIAILHIFC